MKDQSRHWPILVPLVSLLCAMLACGGFQVRVTPTPKPTAALPTATLTSRPTIPPPTAAAPLVAPTRTPTPVPPSPTPAPMGGPAGLAPGMSALISATGGLNVRDKPSTSANLIGKLNANVTVTIRSGPSEADGYVWWEIDNGAGLVGWVAAGTRTDPWIKPEPTPMLAAKGGKLVNRAVRLGDRVQVTTVGEKLLTIREAAGIDSPPVARAIPGTQFIVRGGPIRLDGYLWWQVEGDQIKGWAAEGEPNDRWLTPVEP